jgi:hypothetical protein
MSTNNGNTWNPKNSGITTLDVYSIVRKGTLLFAGTVGEGIFVSDDSGDNWTAVNNGLTLPVAIRCLETDGTRLYAGTRAYTTPPCSSQGIYISDNDGLTWTQVTNGITTDKSVFCIMHVGNAMLAASIDIYRSLDNGLNWTVFMNGISPTCPYGAAGFYETSSYVFSGFESSGCIVSVHRIDKDQVLSIPEEQGGISSGSFYPNPFHQNATLKFENAERDAYILTLYNRLGQAVRIIPAIADERIQIERKDLPDGLYFYQMRSADKSFSGKLIIN